MSIYDVLMTAMLLAIGVLMVLNHRTGWLATRMMNAPRRYARMTGYDAHRVLLDSDEREGDLVRSPSTPSGE